MIIALGAVVVGLLVLIWGADRFVDGAAASAEYLGMSPMLIGITVIAFGTSAPEMIVSATAAWQATPGMAIGNALGSNIANIALVLGATALVTPIVVRPSLIKLELPVLGIATVIGGAVLTDLFLGISDGILLLISLGLALWYLARNQSNATAIDASDVTPMSRRGSFVWLFIGIVSLGLGSRSLVWGATEIALALHVSDLIIGLTIVAVGTSLPELAASVVSARKNHHDMAIGNIIGSNLFNLLGVMALPGLIYPTTVANTALWRDYSLMTMLTLALCFMCWRATKLGGRISSHTGGLLVAIYACYLLLLYVSVASTS